MQGSTGVNMKMFKYLKTFDGLLESSWMFFIQLVVIFTRAPLGDKFGIPTGQCRIPELPVTPHPPSRADGVRPVHQLRQLSVECGRVPCPRCWRGEEHQICSFPHSLLQCPLLLQDTDGCCTIHLLEGGATSAFFFTYPQSWALLIVFPLLIFNMWLTFRTQQKDLEHIQHIKFCTAIGGRECNEILIVFSHFWIFHALIFAILQCNYNSKDHELFLQAEHFCDQCVARYLLHRTGNSSQC